MIISTHIHDAWMFNADPRNLAPLIARLEAPYAARIQRAIRDLLNDGSLTERDKASQLLTLADHLGLVRQPSPRPLPAIDPDDIHLICWTIIVSGAPAPQMMEPAWRAALHRSARSVADE